MPILLETSRRTPAWASWLAFALFALAALRGVLMIGAEPLVALANNYDQTRYTACFDLYPIRPPGVDPTTNNYQAPLDAYAFQPQPHGDCYWTSDLVFQGAAVAVYRVHEALGGDTAHSVRVLGALRLATWLVAGLLVSIAFRRDGAVAAALANLAWLAVLGLDPVNTIYLNTFYSEAGALFFLYLAVALTALVAVRATPGRLALLALAAFALGLSKLQHLALPLCLAGALAVAALWRARALWPAALALVVGGGVACGVQFVQLQRTGPMIESIAVANNVDFALTALLPASQDPAATAARIGLDPACVAHVGKSIYTIGAAPAEACPGIAGLRRSRALALVMTEPGTLVRLFAAVPRDLLPWIPHYLGVVEGGNVAPLPDGYWSVARVFDRNAVFAWLFLLLPAALALAMLLRRRTDPAAIAVAVSCATVALAVPAVSVFGDGIVELAKHSHLALNAGTACVLALVVGAVAARVSGRRRATAI